MNKPKKATKRKPTKRRTLQKSQPAAESAPNDGCASEGDACYQLREEFRVFAESKMPSAPPARDFLQVAARFLEGNDFEHAAKRAFDLLDACRNEAQTRWLEEEMVRPTKRIPFPKAIRAITGLNDSPYAKKVYRQFCIEFLAPAAAFASQEPAGGTDDLEPRFPYRIELVAPGGLSAPMGHEIGVEQWADTLIREEQAQDIGIVQAIFRRALFLMWQPSKNQPKATFDFSWDK